VPPFLMFIIEKGVLVCQVNNSQNLYNQSSAIFYSNAFSLLSENLRPDLWKKRSEVPQSIKS
jgi:hypothetical protein